MKTRKGLFKKKRGGGVGWEYNAIAIELCLLGGTKRSGE